MITKKNCTKKYDFVCIFYEYKVSFNLFSLKHMKISKSKLIVYSEIYYMKDKKNISNKILFNIF